MAARGGCWPSLHQLRDGLFQPPIPSSDPTLGSPWLASERMPSNGLLGLLWVARPPSFRNHCLCTLQSVQKLIWKDAPLKLPVVSSHSTSPCRFHHCPRDLIEGLKHVGLDLSPAEGTLYVLTGLVVTIIGARIFLTHSQRNRRSRGTNSMASSGFAAS